MPRVDSPIKQAPSQTSSAAPAVCILLQNHYEIDIRVRRKAEALVAAGYIVDVLALRSSHMQSKSFVLEGVNVHTVSLGKKRATLVRYAFEYAAFLIWSFWKLFRLMRKRHYAVVDVNNLPDFLVFAAAYAKWKGARIVFDMHEITPEFYISKYGIKEASWLVRLLKFIERASFKFADHVITINSPIEKLLIQRGLPPGKSTVIMNSVDASLFARAEASPNAPRKEAAFVMMYHGTLTPIYGLDIAIEAFAKARSEMPGAEFWILGNGPEKGALKELSQKLEMTSKVKFIGSVLPEEVPAWLNCSDVGVLATRRDIFLDFSFSNKLSEYIIMGKAVISSRLAAIHHYFSGEALAYFEPNDSSALANQMVRMFKDSELRKRQAERAQAEYAPIRWEVMKDRYLKMMESIAGIPVESTAEAEPSHSPASAAVP